MDARSPQIVQAVKAADLLLDRDPWGAAWIAAHRARQAAQAQADQSRQAQQPPQSQQAGT
jgi:5-methyltetrahydrofolate--homocysteine methyltransferase